MHRKAVSQSAAAFLLVLLVTGGSVSYYLGAASIGGGSGSPPVVVTQTSSGSASSSPSSSQTAEPSRSIEHIVIIMQENHGFDNYFGTYPGVLGGYSNTTCIAQTGYPGCIRPFHMTSNIPEGDPCHDWKCQHRDYANGTNSGFYQVAGRLAFGYYDGTNIPYYWQLARNYTLMDNYFSSVMGPTLPNHFYLVAGQAGGVIADDAYLAGIHGKSNYTLNFRSIFSELTDHRVSWGYYGGPALVNWNAPGWISPVFANHTLYDNVRDPADFLGDVKGGRLPQVAWLMPSSEPLSEHPAYDVSAGEGQVKTVVTAIQQSKYWGSTAIIITWDESGGWYDSVPPPQVDAFGYGFRVPALVVSPFARHGFIDHTLSDHTSTLAFVEATFHLRPVAQRDARASNLSEAFGFANSH